MLSFIVACLHFKSVFDVNASVRVCVCVCKFWNTQSYILRIFLSSFVWQNNEEDVEELKMLACMHHLNVNRIEGKFTPLKK